MAQDLGKPLKVKKPTTWAIWNDLFHENVPYDYIADVFNVVAQCSRHTFQILTKRPDRALLAMEAMRDWDYADVCWTGITPSAMLDTPKPYPNIRLGVTVEHPKYLWRISELLMIPAAIHYASIEPMLGPIDLDGYLGDGLGWVICGAEAGLHRRPMKLPWVRSLRDQCIEAGVPFFFKRDSDGNRELDGRTWEQFPGGG